MHRDLKPENMMVKPNGHLILIDFGTCKNIVNTKLNGPEFVGTAEYMSPEAIDNKYTDPNSDLWSLGCILYQMLIGLCLLRWQRILYVSSSTKWAAF